MRSDDELNRIIAEWCGWKPQQVYTTEDHDGSEIVCKGGQQMPNYCRDLNACHEAEMRLTDEQHRSFRFRLVENCFRLGHDGKLKAERRYQSQSARQRAEALVAVIEQQKGGSHV